MLVSTVDFKNADFQALQLNLLRMAKEEMTKWANFDQSYLNKQPDTWEDPTFKKPKVRVRKMTRAWKKAIYYSAKSFVKWTGTAPKL